MMASRAAPDGGRAVSAVANKQQGLLSKNRPAKPGGFFC
jgi:hypothetical protein